MFKTALVIFLLLSGSLAFAFEDCRVFKDEAERLDCYDRKSNYDLFQKLFDEDKQAPTGPPLTTKEKDDFRAQLMACWDFTEAERVIVTLSFSMFANGTVDEGSIKLISSDPIGDEASAHKAFDQARRAIISCQKEGYDLPPKKYDWWRKIEVTFYPEP